MKKSKKVPATLLTAVAAIVAAGCSSGVTEVRRCVDASGKVLPDMMCSGSTTGTGYYGGTHWVYGGSLRGSTVSGYHSTPTPDATINDSSGHTISRGGFGSSGSGSGG